MNLFNLPKWFLNKKHVLDYLITEYGYEYWSRTPNIEKQIIKDLLYKINHNRYVICYSVQYPKNKQYRITFNNALNSIRFSIDYHDNYTIVWAYDTKSKKEVL